MDREFASGRFISNSGSPSMPSTPRETENDNLKPGAPPGPKTGSDGSRSDKTSTDPSTGESRGTDPARNDSAAEDRSPTAHKDRRIKPDV